MRRWDTQTARIKAARARPAPRTLALRAQAWPKAMAEANGRSDRPKRTAELDWVQDSKGRLDRSERPKRTAGEAMPPRGGWPARAGQLGIPPGGYPCGPSAADLLYITSAIGRRL